MSDFRTRRTLIKNSPVKTQTPSWIISRSTSNGRRNSIYRSFIGDSSVLRSSIPTSRSFELRDERTSSSPFVRKLLGFPHHEFKSRYSSNHRFGISSFTIFYAETSLHRIPLQGLDWILIYTFIAIPNQRTARKFLGVLEDISTNKRKRLATALFE